MNPSNKLLSWFVHKFSDMKHLLTQSSVYAGLCTEVYFPESDCELDINSISDLKEITGILLERIGKNSERIPAIPAVRSPDLSDLFWART